MEREGDSECGRGESMGWLGEPMGKLKHQRMKGPTITSLITSQGLDQDRGKRWRGKETCELEYTWYRKRYKHETRNMHLGLNKI